MQVIETIQTNSMIRWLPTAVVSIISILIPVLAVQDAAWSWFFQYTSMQPYFTLGNLIWMTQLTFLGVGSLLLAHETIRWKEITWLTIAISCAAILIMRGLVVFSTLQDRDILTAIALIIISISLVLNLLSENRTQRRFVIIGTTAMTIGHITPIISTNAAIQITSGILILGGTQAVLISINGYMQQHLTLTGRRLTYFGTTILSLIGVGLILAVYMLPTYRWQNRAVHTNISYLEGTLKLIGYELHTHYLKPEESIDITLYWRADEPIPARYGTSTHFLLKPEAQSITNIDTAIHPEHRIFDWLPGVVVSQHIQMSLPETARTPNGYWLQVAIWAADNGALQPISDTGGMMQIDENNVAITGISAFTSNQELSENIQAVNFTFQDRFSLRGYDFPLNAAVGETLDMTFQWQVDQPIQQQLLQFVHLEHHETGEFTFYSHEPLNSRYPTTDWVPGTRFEDQWTLTLPEGISGEFTVYTGMFDAATVERIPVSGDESNISENRIVLGTLRME